MARTLAGVADLARQRLVVERVVDAPALVVWRFLNAPADLATWLGELEAPLSAGQEGRLRLTVEEGAPVSALRVGACDPPRSVAVVVDEWPLELEVAPEGSGTRVRLTHLLGPDLRPEDVRGGWEFYLRRLAWAATGRAGPEPVGGVRRERLTCAPPPGGCAPGRPGGGRA
ncbi:SRPBCC domain-containing protein [Kineococcus terrestris]|uniref:SRPBCC domain-containing protein n=1 Tax=Kineococcus terrestris TaxID=2044856 RepID=UPI0034DB103A